MSEDFDHLRFCKYTSIELDSKMVATRFRTARWSQRAISVFVMVLIGGFGAAIGRADFQPPEIIIDEAKSSRTVQVDVEWFDSELNPFTDEAEEEFTGQGPWQTLLLASGDGVSATGSQVSDVAKFSISGETAVTASNVGEGGRANADSRIAITFSVPVEAPFAFSITFDFAEGPGGEGTNYQGAYLISGLAPFDD